MAAIPFAAKALVGTLPALALEARPTVTLKEIIDEMHADANGSPDHGQRDAVWCGVLCYPLQD